jgi:hypothetical protein
MRNGHAHGPITLLAGNPRCAVLHGIDYMVYEKREAGHTRVVKAKG